MPLEEIEGPAGCEVWPDVEFIITGDINRELNVQFQNVLFDRMCASTISFTKTLKARVKEVLIILYL